MANDKSLLVVSVCMAVVGVGLVVTSVATDHWLASDVVGNKTDNRSETAQLAVGLFNGAGEYDFGLSERKFKLELKCDLSESICGYTRTGEKSDFDKRVEEYLKGNKTTDLDAHGLFGFGWHAATLVMLCLSMVFGLLAIGFGLFNVFGRPIETISGVSGLYLWNALALIFAIAGFATYIGLFYEQLSNTVTNMSWSTVEGTVWQDDTTFDYSFFCVVGAAIAYLLNIFILMISGNKCSCNYRVSGEKEVDNGMILY